MTRTSRIQWLETLAQYVPPLGGVIVADFLVCWRLRVPKMSDVQFAGVRWTGVVAYVVGAVAAVLTTGQILPGVAAPAVIPGPVGAALNGLVAAMLAYVVVYYLLESTGILPGHEVAADAEWL